MSKEPTRIDELLFKPIMYNTGDHEKFILIYDCETKISQIVSPSLKKTKRTTEVLRVIDIKSTLETNRITTETCVVSSLKKFKANVKAVPVDTCVDEIVRVTALLLGEMTVYSQKLSELSNILSSIRSCTKTEATIDGGNIVLAGTEEPLAHIVFQTVSGQKEAIEKVLTQKEVQRMGEVLGSIIMSNLDLDLDDEERVRKLKAEIEFKVIDSLPNNLKAGDVSIDINAVLGEIRGFQIAKDGDKNRDITDDTDTNEHDDGLEEDSE